MTKQNHHHHHQQQPWQQQSLLPAAVNNNDLIINRIISLPDEEFWKLVSVRLNIPLSTNQLEEGKIPDAKDRQYWTEEYLIDKLFLQLAGTKEIVRHFDKHVTVYKYYHQAFQLRKWIPIAKPTPEFVVNISDVSVRIAAELKVLSTGEEKGDLGYVLRQAVGRIFENIDFRQYHLSIARKLKVRLDK